MSRRSEENNPSLSPEPKKPSSDDCCGGGSCCPCVWDEYRLARKKWLEQLQNPQTRPN